MSIFGQTPATLKRKCPKYIFVHEHPELGSKLPKALLKHFLGSKMERQERKCRG